MCSKWNKKSYSLPFMSYSCFKFTITKTTLIANIGSLIRWRVSWPVFCARAPGQKPGRGSIERSVLESILTRTVRFYHLKQAPSRCINSFEVDSVDTKGRMSMRDCKTCNSSRHMTFFSLLNNSPAIDKLPWNIYKQLHPIRCW